MKDNLYSDISSTDSGKSLTYLVVLLAVIAICLASSRNLMAQQANYTQGAARAGSFPPNTGKQLRNDNLTRNPTPPGAKLSSFTGAADNGQNLLSWETVVEENVKQYDLEYSYNNKDFQRAGVIVAANKNMYAFNHITAAKSLIWYRLKVTELNGSTQFTNTISVANTKARPDDEVSPSIIRDGMLNITLNNSYRNLRVFNNSGVEVFRDNVGGRTGNRIGFDLPKLPAGPYYVRLDGVGISTTKKIMIM